MTVQEVSTARSVEDHLAAILALATPLPVIELTLAEAIGRPLARDVRAVQPSPPWDAAAMDGFAVRAADTVGASPEAPTSLAVVAEVRAGSASDPRMPNGTAIRIMTGAPMPTDADAVVPVEHIAGGFVGSAENVLVERGAARAGAHVRRRGEDIAAGQLLAAAGTVLHPIPAASAAAAGVSTAAVTRVPRVAVVSTGDELAGGAAPLRRGAIPESNSLLLSTLAAAAGAEVVRAVAADDVAALGDLFARPDIASCDVVLTSGGISAGLYEVVRLALGASAGVRFVSVDMRPGHPQAYGRFDDGRLFLGFPGSPAGAALSFEVFARPLLLHLQRATTLQRPRLRLRVAEGWAGRPGRPRFVAVAIDTSDPAGWVVRPYAAAATVPALSGYALVPPEQGSVASGDTLEVRVTA